MKKIITLALVVILCATMLSIKISADSSISNDDLDKYIQTEFEKTHIPNMSIEIVDEDNVLFNKNYGGNVNNDTPFILGSISKSFTGLAIMQLVEQGKVDISATVASYLPNIMNTTSKTTLKQLLNHTSGIHTNMTLENFSSSDTTVGYEYANVNYDLLGLIVEKVSGISYSEYIKKNIYEPLGMNNSYVSIEEAKENGIAFGHRNYFGIMVEEEFDYPKNMTSGWMSLSAAYLISTTNDMGSYLQFWLKGNENVLTEETKKQAFLDTAFVTDGYEYGYGWGISKSEDITMYVHGGNVENYTTYMVLLPNLNKAIIVLTDACDFFSSNDMVVKLAENIGCKLSNVETVDIDSNAYLTTHIILDIVMLVIIASFILPLVFFKKWYQKVSITARYIITFVLLHIVLPTVLLLVPTFLGSPMWVALRFAPDLAVILLVSGISLYLTGIAKIVCVFIKNKKNTTLVK